MNRVKTSLLYLRSPLVPHLFLANAVARCHCSSISLLLAVCDPADFYSPLCTSNTYVLRTVNCAGTSRLTRSVKSCVNSDLFYAHVDVFFSYEVTRSIKRIPCEPFVFFLPLVGMRLAFLHPTFTLSLHSPSASILFYVTYHDFPDTV